jgi:hypothetical protein
LVLSGGWLYGTTTFGGASAKNLPEGKGYGTVFVLSTSGDAAGATAYKTLYNFTGSSQSDEGFPGSLSLLGSTLVGTTSGSTSGILEDHYDVGPGTVYSINLDTATTPPSAQGGLALDFAFPNDPGMGTTPMGDLIVGGPTVFIPGRPTASSTPGYYVVMGTTVGGNNGAVFEYQHFPPGLNIFSEYSLPNSYGTDPQGGLASGSAAFGTAEHGGANQYGTVFEFQTPLSGVGLSYANQFFPHGLNLNWVDPPGVYLESAPTVNGPWAIVATNSPYTIAATNSQQFFQLVMDVSMPSPLPPVVATLQPGSINSNSATLFGSVVPNGADSTWWFQYGLTTNYGQSTSPQNLSVTNSNFVSSSINGLSPAAAYHYQLVASNSAGTSTGADLQFTTLICVTPPSSLAYWWPANSNAFDIIGGNNGTLQGGVTYTNGEVGQAFSLDGSTGFISTSTLITNPQTFSLSLWFKTATTNGGVLISFDSTQTNPASNTYDRNIYMDNTGALHFGVWTGVASQINSAAGYNDTAWHWVVGSLSASTGLSLYVDGVLAGNNPAVTNAVENYNGYWRFGEDNLLYWPYQPSSYYFQGQVDEVAIFNTVLSSNDVAAIYGVGSAGMCPP